MIAAAYEPETQVLGGVANQESLARMAVLMRFTIVMRYLALAEFTMASLTPL